MQQLRAAASNSISFALWHWYIAKFKIRGKDCHTSAASVHALPPLHPPKPDWYSSFRVLPSMFPESLK